MTAAELCAGCILSCSAPGYKSVAALKWRLVWTGIRHIWEFLSAFWLLLCFSEWCWWIEAKPTVICCSAPQKFHYWINDMMCGPLSLGNRSITELPADLWRTTTLWLHFLLSIQSKPDWLLGDEPSDSDTLCLFLQILLLLLQLLSVWLRGGQILTSLSSAAQEHKESDLTGCRQVDCCWLFCFFTYKTAPTCRVHPTCSTSLKASCNGSTLRTSWRYFINRP